MNTTTGEDRIRLAAKRTTERTRSIVDLATEGFDEQPSPRAVLAAARRLCAAITACADDVIERRFA